MPDFCPDDCPHLASKPRPDYYPPGADYWCGTQWIGFLPRKIPDCQENSANKEAPQ